MHRRRWMIPLIGLAALGFVRWALAADDGHLRHVQPATAFFGMQAIPKFDELSHHGSWQGTRDRGLAMDRDLGVQLTREGYVWLQDEPEPDRHPNQADFDDAIARARSAGMAIELMVTDTPYWASTAPHKDPGRPDSYRHAPPINLDAPVFEDGTDIPGPGKRLNPHQYWGRMIARVASRYRGQVRYYQVWNEPDYPRGDTAANFTDPERSFQGSVSDYVRLLQVTHAAIACADPAATVVTGGLGHAPYLQAILDEHGGNFFDAVDFHAYGGPGSDQALRGFLSVYAHMRQTLLHNKLTKGLLCSETGYPAKDPRGQAAYLPKVFATGLALGLEGIIYYSNTNPAWQQMGLVDWHTMQQRTAGYWAYKTTANALAGLVYSEKLPVPPQIVAYRFVDPVSRRRVILAWAPFRTAENPVVWRPDEQIDWQVVSPDGRSTPYRLGDRLLLASTPLLLDSDPARAYQAAKPNPPRLGGRVAVEAIAADSSDPGGFHEPDLAIDGDPDTEWLSAEYADTTSLRVRLTRLEALSGLTLKTGPMEGARLEVDASPDGLTWSSVATGLVFADWASHDVPFARPVKARWVRLRWIRDPGKGRDRARLFELWLR